MRRALVNGRVLTKHGTLQGHAVLLEDDLIADVVAMDDRQPRRPAPS